MNVKHHEEEKAGDNNAMDWGELGKKRFLVCQDFGPPHQLKSRAESQCLITNTVTFSNQHTRGLIKLAFAYCVSVLKLINKRSFEPFCVLIKLAFAYCVSVLKLINKRSFEPFCVLIKLAFAYCVSVLKLINKRSFEPFCVLIKLAPEIRNTSTTTKT